MVVFGSYCAGTGSVTSSATSVSSSGTYYLAASDTGCTDDYSGYVTISNHRQSFYDTRGYEVINSDNGYSTGSAINLDTSIIYDSYLDNQIIYLKKPVTYYSNIIISTDNSSSIALPFTAEQEKALKKQEFRNRIRRQLAPEARPENEGLLRCNNDPAELKARGLLRELVGEKAFRDYLRRGFISVKGKSGLFYRIFGGTRHMTSYAKHDDGKFYPHEDICVVFCDRNLPLTDGVVMRLLLVENDEFALRRLANVRAMRPQTTSKPIVGLVA